jgi:hypothetical protein
LGGLHIGIVAAKPAADAIGLLLMGGRVVALRGGLRGEKIGAVALYDT